MAQTRGLAALPGHQRAQQPLAVDRIRLGAPVASGTAIFGSRPTAKFVPCREVESESYSANFVKCGHLPPDGNEQSSRIIQTHRGCPI